MLKFNSIFRFAVFVPAILALAAPASGQFFRLRTQTNGRFELSDAVDVKDLPNEAAAHLARVDALLADEKWDEAVETLRGVAENHGERVLELEERRFINVRDYCHIRLSSLPAEARTLYRDRVDPVAESWYLDGVENRNEQMLQRVVDEFFASSFGDDALLALGEIALERGDFGRARWCWEQTSPLLRGEFGLPVWYAVYAPDLDKDWPKLETQFEKRTEAANWLAYPDTDIDLASVRARLVLVSILQQATDRAQLELTILKRLHPGAKGYLAGKTGPYEQTLAELLDESVRWAQPPEPNGWKTFAGSQTRNLPRTSGVDLTARPAWTLSFADFMNPPPESHQPSARRGGPDSDLAVHPLVIDDLVLLCSRDQVFAFDLETVEEAIKLEFVELFTVGQGTVAGNVIDRRRSLLNEHG